MLHDLLADTKKVSAHVRDYYVQDYRQVRDTAERTRVRLKVPR